MNPSQLQCLTEMSALIVRNVHHKSATSYYEDLLEQLLIMMLRRLLLFELKKHFLISIEFNIECFDILLS